MSPIKTFASLADWRGEWDRTDYAEIRLGLIHALPYIPYSAYDKIGWEKRDRADYLGRIDVCLQQAEELVQQGVNRESQHDTRFLLARSAFKYALDRLSLNRTNNLGFDQEQIRRYFGKEREQAATWCAERDQELRLRESQLLILLGNTQFISQLHKKEFGDKWSVFLAQLQLVPELSLPVSWYDAAVTTGCLRLLPPGHEQSILSLARILFPENESRPSLHWLLESADTMPLAQEYLKHLVLAGSFEKIRDLF